MLPFEMVAKGLEGAFSEISTEKDRVRPLWIRMLADAKLQSFAAKTPILRRLVRKDQRRIFDLMVGFAYSQALYAAVQIDLFDQVLYEAKDPRDITGLSAEAASLLCRALAGLNLLKERRDGRFTITRQGALVETVPGLKTMILHHAVLYRDLADPLAVLEGNAETEMSEFWPYVFGATDRPVSGEEAALYSQVMTDTQSLVAREVLSNVSFAQSRRLLDVGGGTGTFASHVASDFPSVECAIFDLPNVVDQCDAFKSHPGNFREDSLPQGYDTISLIRILFDHRDETATALLTKVYSALPDSGRLVIAEPMAGNTQPSPEGDAYYALYTRAMKTGRTRRPSEISDLLSKANFKNITVYPDRAPSVARVMSAEK
ncbi:MAG: methyltransferase [Pseudomonadota bacterium]